MAARFLRRGKKRPRRPLETGPQIVEGEGWVPVTPGGSILTHLEASTEEQAWKNLMIDAAHMPYRDQAAFEARGYEVCKMHPGEDDGADA